MSVKEILEFEKRTNGNLYKIHFFLEGGWWRAYEMSAYLCNHIGDDTLGVERLKTTKKILKDGTEYIFVGLKLSSFSKYFPQINLDNNEYDIDEYHMVFDVSDLYDTEDDTLMVDKFEQWKMGVKLQDKKGKSSNTENIPSKNTTTFRENTFFGIVQKLLSYPINDRTPNENTQFIMTLKQELMAIII